MWTRRQFLGRSAAFAATSLLPPLAYRMSPEIPVGAHLWVYASRFPPDWDCTPVIEEVFRDLSYAGIEGLEVMHSNLRHANAVDILGDLSTRYRLPVIGTSYGADMWNRQRHAAIVEETGMLFEKLSLLKAVNFGISVGDARRRKTEEELDDQADLLKRIRPMAANHGIICNLHNHTYEVVDSFHDLGGTLKRIPDFPLGPDLNWLIRGGADPIEFIRKFGDQIVYLHLRDQYRNGEWTEGLGEGDTDFNAIASALKEVPFSGTATIELAFPANFKPTRPLRETWKKSRNHVKAVFGY